MNTYDAAYDLARAIKESDEMKRLTAAADKVKNDADAKKMVKEYIMAQMQADYAKLAGQKDDEKTYQHLQQCPGISPGFYSLESGGCGFAEDRLGCNGAGYGCIGIR